MKKNIFYIIFLVVIFASCKKEKGESFMSNRTIDSFSVVTAHLDPAYPYARAYMDSLVENEIIIDSLAPGEISNNKDTLVKAYIKLSSYFFDIDSIVFLKAGFCWSTTQTQPTMRNAFFQYTITDSTKINIDDYTFEFSDRIDYLKTDTRYYVRSFVIGRDLHENRYDTAYNQQVLSFRTRIAEDVWFSKKLISGMPRYEAVSFVLNNEAYIAGGENGAAPLRDCWKYNSSDDTWSQAGDMRFSRKSAVAFVINDKYDLKRAYVGLGIVDALGTKSDEFESYNSTNNSWEINTYRKFEGGKRSNAVAFVLKDLQGKDAAFVGFGENNYPVTDLYWYDLKADTAGSLLAWKQINATGLPNYGITEACATEINNKAYIFGGVNGNGDYQKNMVIYDPTISVTEPQGHFSVVSNFKGTPRANASMFSLTYEKNGETFNYVYVGTGRTNGDVYLNDFWGYDLNQGIWIQKSYFKGEPCEGAVGFDIVKDHDDYGLKVLSRGFIGTGKTKNESTIWTRELWEYLP